MPLINDDANFAGVYADDIAEAASGTSVIEAEHRVQRHVDVTKAWCNRWLLKLAPGKCWAQTIASKPAARPPQLTIDGEAIPTAESGRYLGVTVDNKMTWEQHLGTVIVKAQ